MPGEVALDGREAKAAGFVLADRVVAFPEYVHAALCGGQGGDRTHAAVTLQDRGRAVICDAEPVHGAGYEMRDGTLRSLPAPDLSRVSGAGVTPSGWDCTRRSAPFNPDPFATRLDIGGLVVKGLVV